MFPLTLLIVTGLWITKTFPIRESPGFVRYFQVYLQIFLAIPSLKDHTWSKWNRIWLCRQINCQSNSQVVKTERRQDLTDQNFLYVMFSYSFKSAFKSALILELWGKVSASSSNFGDVCRVALSTAVQVYSSCFYHVASLACERWHFVRTYFTPLLLQLLTKWLFTSQKRPSVDAAAKLSQLRVLLCCCSTTSINTPE